MRPYLVTHANVRFTTRRRGITSNSVIPGRATLLPMISVVHFNAPSTQQLNSQNLNP